MTVVGYNHTDTEDCIGIEMEMQDGEPVACVYIGQAYSQTEHHLAYKELCNFIGQAREVKSEMEWELATHAYAREWQSMGTYHLIPKGEVAAPTDYQKSTEDRTTSTKFGKSLCGRKAPVWSSGEERGWTLSPVVGEPASECCKRCLAAYRKGQEAANGQ